VLSNTAANARTARPDEEDADYLDMLKRGKGIRGSTAIQAELYLGNK
jgi:hypothetical protein